MALRLKRLTGDSLAGPLFRALGAVLRTSLTSLGDPARVQGTPDDVVTHTGKVFHTPAAHQNDRVLLEGVPFARDVSGYLDPVGKAHTRDLAQSGVRLLRRHGTDH